MNIPCNRQEERWPFVQGSQNEGDQAKFCGVCPLSLLNPPQEFCGSFHLMERKISINALLVIQVSPNDPVTANIIFFVKRSLFYTNAIKPYDFKSRRLSVKRNSCFKPQPFFRVNTKTKGLSLKRQSLNLSWWLIYLINLFDN